LWISASTFKAREGRKGRKEGGREGEDGGEDVTQKKQRDGVRCTGCGDWSKQGEMEGRREEASSPSSLSLVGCVVVASRECEREKKREGVVERTRCTVNVLGTGVRNC
jgi:hypothetical protein